MAVSILGTPLAIVDGTLYVAESGLNRAVVVSVGVEELNSVTFAPTLGGQAFTQIAFLEGSTRSYVYVGYILEADIPAGSNAFALNPSAAVDATTGTIYTLDSVDQVSPASGFTKNQTSSQAPILGITGVADGLAVAVYTHDTTASITADSNWSTQSINAGSGHRVYTASKSTLVGADTFEPTTGVNVNSVLGSAVFNASTASGPTLTDPDSVTEGTLANVTGTDLDTVVAFALQTQSTLYGLVQSSWVDSSAVAGSFTPESGVNLAVPGTNAPGLPMDPTITAAGVTIDQIQMFAFDGVTAGTRDIDFLPEATHDCVQVMTATSNVTDGESVLAPIILNQAPENDMQYYAPKSVNGMNITWAADGTFTTNKDQTETIRVYFWSPAASQWGATDLTITQSSVTPVTGDIINTRISIGIGIGI